MHVFNFYEENRIKLGALSEQRYLDVAAAAAELGVFAPQSMQALILSGKNGLKLLETLFRAETADLLPEALRYAPAVTAPEKILCVGLNYQKHSDETPFERPETPVLFSKYNNALAAHAQYIALPTAAFQCDYEGELVVVIGKEAKNVSAENAADYIFGYTVGNDLSARALQMRTSQWLLGKTLDGFAPLGPTINVDKNLPVQNLRIQTHLNGQLRQDGATADMLFDCAFLISYISSYMTLKPGDLLFTGTPEGVILGQPENERLWLKPGDVVSVTIEELGTLTNQMI